MRKLIYTKTQLNFSFIAGAELVDSVLDVVRKEAESCDCLQVRCAHPDQHGICII
jgi:hypothetical protein